MIESLTHSVTNQLPLFIALGSWIYVIIMLVATIESTPILGTFTPGTLFLLFFGFVAAQGHMNLALCILFATAGATLGDCLAYVLGKYGKRFFKKEPEKSLLKMSHLEMGQKFFKLHGKKSVLFGRFIGVIRPIIPLVAGAVSMDFKKFLILNIVGAYIWSGVLISSGYLLGDNWEMVEHVMTRFGLGALILVVILIWLFIKAERKARAMMLEDSRGHSIQDGQ